MSIGPEIPDAVVTNTDQCPPPVFFGCEVTNTCAAMQHYSKVGEMCLAECHNILVPLYITKADLCVLSVRQLEH